MSAAIVLATGAEIGVTLVGHCAAIGGVYGLLATTRADHAVVYEPLVIREASVQAALPRCEVPRPTNEEAIVSAKVTGTDGPPSPIHVIATGATGLATAPTEGCQVNDGRRTDIEGASFSGEGQVIGRGQARPVTRASSEVKDAPL